MFKTAAVIGAGVMGTGIARHLAGSVGQVLLVDINEQQLETAQGNVEGLNITCSSDFSLLSQSDYVIEAVLEDIDVKRKVLKQISDTSPAATTIATNTSSLLVGDLASAVENPQRFLGVHYNNPADMNPVVEIIAGLDTAETLVTDIQNWMTSTGKLAIRCADTSGFILNRQSLPYINEAARCLDVATPSQIDQVAIKKLGVGLGPFAVMNLVGLPVMAAASRNLAILGEGYLPASAMQTKAAAEDKVWKIDDATSLGESLATEICDRLLGAMIFPGQDILKQSLCARDDLHTICINALGYKRSSPELIEQLEATRVQQLLKTFIEQQKLAS